MKIKDWKHWIDDIEKNEELSKLEKGKRELFEGRLKQIENWKKDREKDFNMIEQYAKEIDDEKEFQKEHK